jgi:phospholipid/cholesterol/gamma-HCH transport system permease protein
LTLFAGQVLAACFRLPYRGTLTPVSYMIGVRSVPVVVITGTFIGMVLAVQAYSEFAQAGLATQLGRIVNTSVVRELGPVLAATMLAGRVGSAMAAELGTMRVTEQIDALRTLATHPVDYLVVPRLLATIIAMPLLTAESISVGILAGYVVGATYLDIYPSYAWDNMVKYTTIDNALTGIIKAFVYGGLIALISCYKGMTCGEGAEGVGRATTEAVVYSAITILISNFFLTLFLNRVLES